MKRDFESMLVCVHENKQIFLQVKNVVCEFEEPLLELPSHVFLHGKALQHCQICLKFHIVSRERAQQHHLSLDRSYRRQ